MLQELESDFLASVQWDLRPGSSLHHFDGILSMPSASLNSPHGKNPFFEFFHRTPIRPMYFSRASPFFPPSLVFVTDHLGVLHLYDFYANELLRNRAAIRRQSYVHAPDAALGAIERTKFERRSCYSFERDTRDKPLPGVADRPQCFSRFEMRMEENRPEYGGYYRWDDTSQIACCGDYVACCCPRGASRVCLLSLVRALEKPRRAHHLAKERPVFLSLGSRVLVRVREPEPERERGGFLVAHGIRNNTISLFDLMSDDTWSITDVTALGGLRDMAVTRDHIFVATDERCYVLNARESEGNDVHLDIFQSGIESILVNPYRPENELFLGLTDGVVALFDIRKPTEWVSYEFVVRDAIMKTVHAGGDLFVSCARRELAVWKCNSTGRMEAIRRPIQDNATVIDIHCVASERRTADDKAVVESDDSIREVVHLLLRESEQEVEADSRVMWTVTLKFSSSEEMRFPVALFGLSRVLQRIDESWSAEGVPADDVFVAALKEMSEEEGEILEDEESEEEGEQGLRPGFLLEDSEVEDSDEEVELDSAMLSPVCGSSFHRNYVVDLESLSPVLDVPLMGITRTKLLRILLGDDETPIRPHHLIYYFILFMKLQLFQHAFVICRRLKAIQRPRTLSRVMKQAATFLEGGRRRRSPKTAFTLTLTVIQTVLLQADADLLEVSRVNKRFDPALMALVGRERLRRVLRHRDFATRVSSDAISFSSLANATLVHLCRSKAFADVTVISGSAGTEVYRQQAHLAILLWKMVFIRRMLQFDGMEKHRLQHTAEIEIGMTTNLVLRVLLSFVYRGSLASASAVSLATLVNLLLCSEMLTYRKLTEVLQPKILDSVLRFEDEKEAREHLHELHEVGSSFSAFAERIFRRLKKRRRYTSLFLVQ